MKNTTKSFISNVSLHSTPIRELQIICIYITDDYELMDAVFRSLIEVLKCSNTTVEKYYILDTKILYIYYNINIQSTHTDIEWRLPP